MLPLSLLLKLLASTCVHFEVQEHLVERKVIYLALTEGITPCVACVWQKLHRIERIDQRLAEESNGA